MPTCPRPSVGESESIGGKLRAIRRVAERFLVTGIGRCAKRGTAALGMGYVRGVGSCRT